MGEREEKRDMDLLSKQSRQGRSLLELIADGLLLVACLSMIAVFAYAVWFVLMLRSLGD
jgi:hypothetical protein